jgi:hypothetical protein
MIALRFFGVLCALCRFRLVCRPLRQPAARRWLGVVTLPPPTRNPPARLSPDRQRDRRARCV